MAPVETAASRRALRWAEFLARKWNAAVIPLHAFEPVVHAPLEIAGVMPVNEIHADLQLEARRWLESATLDAGGTDVAECTVCVGDPADEILEAIGRERADLVVIGSRGVASPIGAALGSVARTLLRTAPVSVLVVGPLGR